MKNSNQTLFAKTFIIACALLCAGVVLAWSGPVASPPTCTSGNPGCDAPLNVANSTQTKAGGSITVSGGGAMGATSFCLPGSNPTGGCITTWPTGTSQWTTSGSNIYYTAGNVGVGATSPLVKLTVASGGSGAGLDGGEIAQFAQSGNSYVTIRAAAHTLLLGYEGAAELGTFSNDPLNFLVGNQALMTLGTSAGLSVGATASGDGSVTSHGANAGFAATDRAGNGNVSIFYRNGNTTALYDNTAGNVISFNTAGNVTVANTVTASAYYYSSDERLKKNIASIASSTALQDILALNPVTFNWISPKQSASTQIGFIAQQVQKVVPELVSTDSSTTLEAVDYARVTPLLVGAAQAQEQKIDALQEQVQSEQQQIDQLSAEIKTLQAR